MAAAITRADIAGIHAEYGKAHPYGANRLVGIVRKMYNVGRQLGIVPEEMRNPGTEIPQFPERKRRQVGGHRLGQQDAVHRQDEERRARPDAVEPSCHRET